MALHLQDKTSMAQAMEDVTNELLAAIPDDLPGMVEKYKEQTRMNILEYALKKGDIMPDFLLPDTNGNLVNSVELRSKGPIVVTFFRGDWCPYCHATINILQEYHANIKVSGATLVAISPQSVERSHKMREAGNITYPVLSDAGCQFIQSCNLAYLMDDEYFRTSPYYVEVTKASASNDWMLPIPTTYVVDTDGTILYSFMEGEVWNRPEPYELIRVLPPINKDNLTTLTSRLEHEAYQLEAMIQPDQKKLVDRDIARLRSTGLENKAVQVGQDYIPFELYDTMGTLVRSAALLKKGPLMISFFQGNWSKLDKLELKFWKKCYQNLRSRGVTLVAISPLSAKKGQALSEKLGNLPFPLLSDEGNRVASKYRLLYRPNRILEQHRLPSPPSSSSSSRDACALTMPATYIINPNRTVQYAFANVDPTLRADPERITRSLPPKRSSAVFGRKPRAPGIFSIKKRTWLPFFRNGKGSTKTIETAESSTSTSTGSNSSYVGDRYANDNSFADSLSTTDSIENILPEGIVRVRAE